MRTYHTFYTKKFYVDIGWYPGDPFTLFFLAILNLDSAPTLFALQIAKFSFIVGLI